MNQKPIAIGIDDYKRIVDRSYYYIDKTLFIKDLLDNGTQVNLFTRPRRFGKTLALSMLKTFFECEVSPAGESINNAHYFKETKILQCGEKYRYHMGQYPVIFLSLKSAKQPDFTMAYQILCEELSEEYKRHAYIINNDVLSTAEKIKYEAIMNLTASVTRTFST